MSGRATCAVIDLDTMSACILDAAADADNGDAGAPGAAGRG